MVFGIAAVLVLLVLVFEFRALSPALLILGAAPLSLGGSFLLLRSTGSELNVSSAMGLILLVGLVVKNGIVMLDYARDAAARRALRRRSQRRARPAADPDDHAVHALRLLPLALGLGAGAELQRPLALAVIGGLRLSTLVLFAVPGLFLLTRRDRPRRTPK